MDKNSYIFGPNQGMDILEHYGTKFHSGRYPYGSGEDPYQHAGDFLSRVQQLQKENGMTKREIASAHGMSVDELNFAIQKANEQRIQEAIATCKNRMEKGESRSSVARDLGVSESTLREWEKGKVLERREKIQNVVDILKKEVDEKGIIDIGEGVELELGITSSMLKQAIYNLEAQTGYYEGGIGVKNPTDPNFNHQTNVKVLCKDRDIYKEAYKDPQLIKSITDYYSEDGGKTFNRFQYPESVDSKRIQVRYAEDDGVKKDGMIEIRPGCKDLDLGDSHYAQVRILVDGTHYLKGMAVYSDDLPDGCDIRFNTNKHKGTPMTGNKDNTVLKNIKDDPANPFGATITAKGQSTYLDEHGKRKLSAINKLSEEGDYDTSNSKNLSSQFLSKQPIKLIKQQLDRTMDLKKGQYEDICSLNNPVVRKKFLKDFADDCDAEACHMQAVGLPRQHRQVLLGLNTIKDDEVYAPNYKNGEKVALIRYPHAGKFEIPILTVNNGNEEGKKIITPQGKDAIGISMKAAAKLSGADFDGDCAITIPITSKSNIKSQKTLKGLEGFDPKEKYPYSKGIRTMRKDEVQKQMGMISNLITDMTLKGAPESDISKAVRHSMVVIDAEKHRLDYKRSEIDNDIPLLKKKYQTGGASTLLSRRKQEVEVNERQGSPRIDSATGKYIYKESGRTYDERKLVKVRDKETGKMVPKIDPVTKKPIYKDGQKGKLAKEKVPLLSVTDDLRTLSSGTEQENLYANYGNSLKALANQARKEYMSTGSLHRSKEAATKYANEVGSLNAKLNTAIKNKPKEREAIRIANSKSAARIRDNYIIDKDEKQKIRTQEVNDARARVGANSKGTKVNITDKEWEAIQAGAVSGSFLNKLLQFSNEDRVRELAMPNQNKGISDSKRARLKSLANSGYTTSEIAASLGISVSTVKKYLDEN